MAAAKAHRLAATAARTANGHFRIGLIPADGIGKEVVPVCPPLF